MLANPYVFFRSRDGDGRVGSSINHGNNACLLSCLNKTTAAAVVDNCLGVERNAQAVNNNGNCSGKTMVIVRFVVDTAGGYHVSLR